MADTQSSESDSSSAEIVKEADRFEDVFSHHIVEIEQVWKQLSVARAADAKFTNPTDGKSQLNAECPIEVDAIRSLAERELHEMREFEEGGADEVADGLSNEASVLLSFVGSMFIENLMLKTMYHLPQNRALGLDVQRHVSSNPTFESSVSSSAPGEAPPTATLDSSTLTQTSSTVTESELVITREDVRRALLRDENFDFLVQAGLAQPGLDSFAEATLDEITQKDPTQGERIHLGYWKIVERTFSALEPSLGPQTPRRRTHHPEQLTSLVTVVLKPEKDATHKRLTLFPDNEDLERNTIEFSLAKTSQEGSTTKATITGRVSLGQIDITQLAGADVELLPHAAPSLPTDSTEGRPNIPNAPMNFSWEMHNEVDPDFPLAGRPTLAPGHGSVQLMSGNDAYHTFGSPWLKDCTWGVLSLDMNFELGDSGFLLHNHYIAIPIFVKIPDTLLSNIASSSEQ